MKKWWILALLLPLAATAQTEQSLLWRISRVGSEQVSYLFGTIHSNDSLLNDFGQKWWNAFNQCDVFTGEVNITDPNELLVSMTASMMKDTSLSDLYSAEELYRVQQFILSKVDAGTAMMLGRMMPFYIMAALMEMPSDDSPYEMLMDFRLQRIAEERGMKILGLESATEQAQSVEIMSLKAQASMLLEYVDSGDVMNKEVESMERLYLRQHLDSLVLLEQQFEVPDVLMASILDGRNVRFVSRLLPLLENQRVFCAVGALHLPGAAGMIAQLRRNGYNVEPEYFSFGE